MSLPLTARKSLPLRLHETSAAGHLLSNASPGLRAPGTDVALEAGAEAAQSGPEAAARVQQQGWAGITPLSAHLPLGTAGTLGAPHSSHAGSDATEMSERMTKGVTDLTD